MKKAGKFYRGAMKNLGEVLRERKESDLVKGGGDVFELDIKSMRVALVKAVRMVVAVRQMMRPLGLEFVEVQDIEREFRQQAGEVQKAEKMMADGLPVVLVKDWTGRQEASGGES